MIIFYSYFCSILWVFFLLCTCCFVNYHDQTHASVPPEHRAALGISDNLIRLSIGIEHVDDLVEDLTQALGQVAAAAATSAATTSA